MGDVQSHMYYKWVQVINIKKYGNEGLLWYTGDTFSMLFKTLNVLTHKL